MSDTSRRQYINHAGRGLLGVGEVGALPPTAAEAGRLKMDPAFPCQGLHLEKIHAPDSKQVTASPKDPQQDQFTLEMDHMAACVRQNKTPDTPGEEGLQDQRSMEAIYKSRPRKQAREAASRGQNGRFPERGSQGGRSIKGTEAWLGSQKTPVPHNLRLAFAVNACGPSAG